MQKGCGWLLVGLVWLLSATGAAQNLIPNDSFETYRSCPKLDNLLDEATPWYNPNRATPDFYHECFQSGQMLLPPRSGQGVARLFFDQGWEEYLGVQLIKPLDAGQCYYFEMYIATDTPEKYLTETIGAAFSSRPLTGASTDFLTLPSRPQVIDNRTRSNVARLQWQQLSGVFKANGGEQYATLGSFFKTPAFLGFYYLFIDDVSLVPINLDLGRDTTLCGRSSTYRLDATTPGATDYRWNDGSTNPTLLVTRPGKYSVTATTACKKLTDSIMVDYALDFSLGRDTTLCEGQRLPLSVPTAPAADYRWQDGSRQNTYTATQTGQYSIQVTQASCVAADTIQVRFIPPPQLSLGPDRELCGAEAVTLTPQYAEGKFTWQDAYATPERIVNRSGVFRASVQNDCAVVPDSVEINYGACDCVLYAPNSFTPNGDGLNDVFLAYGCGDMTLTSLTVFDRWGEVIYQTATEPFQWNGYYRGQLCPTGVYTWRIQYQLNRGRKLTVDQKHGSLTLIR